MTLLLKQLFGFIRLLNSETGTNQIAFGLSFGMLIGFAPAFSLQTLVFFLLILIFRIQLGAAFFSSFIFKLIAFALDPAFDWVGRGILESVPLRPFFITLHNLPLFPLTRFNNSIVMGGLALSLTLLVPAFFAFRLFVFKYRDLIWNRFQYSKVWKLMTASKVYFLYQKYAQFTGN